MYKCKRSLSGSPNFAIVFSCLLTPCPRIQSEEGPRYCLVKCFNSLIHCTDQKTEYTYNGKDIIYINIPQIDLTQDVIKMMCSLIESMTIMQ